MYPIRFLANITNRRKPIAALLSAGEKLSLIAGANRRGPVQLAIPLELNREAYSVNSRNRRVTDDIRQLLE